MSQTSEIQYHDFSLKTHQRVGEQEAFVKVQFEVTYGCNLHCVHCYTDPLNKPELLKKELSYAQIIQTLDHLHEEGILWISFTGGEIFMRKDFLDIYDYAYSRGFIITLLTNVTLITPELADYFKEKPPLCFDISLHGATSETFDKVTQVKGSFEKFMVGIRALVDRDLPVKVKTKAMTINQHEISEIQKLVESLGLKFNLDGILYPRLDGSDSSCQYRLSPNQIIEFEMDKQIASEESCIANKEGLEPPIEEAVDPEHAQSLYRCGCGKLQAHIDPYGRIGSCTWSRKNRFKLKDKSLQEGMKELAESLYSQKYSKESPCHSCVASFYCEKMPEMAPFETGSVEEVVEHFCSVAFGKMERVKQFRTNQKKEES